MEKNSTTGDGYFNGGFLKGWTVRRNKTISIPIVRTNALPSYKNLSPAPNGFFKGTSYRLFV